MSSFHVSEVKQCMLDDRHVCLDQIKTQGLASYRPMHCAARDGNLKEVSRLISAGASLIKRDATWNTPLHIAAATGHTEIVTLLVESTDHLNLRNINRETALYCAAASGHLDVVEVLLKAEASADKRNKESKTPLHASAKQGYLAIVKSLFSNGALLNKVDKDGKTPLFSAAENGHLDVVKFLVANGIDVHEGDNTGMSALHIASARGYLDIAEHLISQGEADVTEENNEGSTPLHDAARHGFAEIVRLLVSSGVPVNKQNKGGNTALHEAAAEGRKEVLDILIASGAHVKKKNADEETALCIAKRKGNTAIVETLTSAESKINNANKDNIPDGLAVAAADSCDTISSLIESCTTPDIMNGVPSAQANLNKTSKHDITLIHVDVGTGVPPVVNLIAEGVDINKKNKYGETLLHVAVQEDDINVVVCLVKAGAKVSEGEDCDQRTPVHIAAQEGRLDITRIMVSAGSSVNGRDGDGNTPLHIAAGEGHTEVSACLISAGAVVNSQNDENMTPLHVASKGGHEDATNCLLANSADVTARDIMGWTALHYAVFEGHLQTAKRLVQNGADIEAEDDEGVTPLHLASEVGNISIILYLLKQNTGRNETNEDQTHAGTSAHQFISKGDFKGWTPLHVAATLGRSDVVKILTSSGADVDQEDADGWTALHAAAQAGHPGVVRHLVSLGADASRGPAGGWTPLRLAACRGHMDVIRLLMPHGMGGGHPSKQHAGDPPYLDQITDLGKETILAAVRFRLATFETLNTFSATFRTLKLILIVSVTFANIIHAAPSTNIGTDLGQPITLTKGETATIPFTFSWTAQPDEVTLPYVTIKFKVKGRPFYVNEEAFDNEGFKAESQHGRFSVMHTYSTYRSLTVDLTIDQVDVEDGGVYIATLLLYRHSDASYDGSREIKLIQIYVPPGEASCYVGVSEYVGSLAETHCQANRGTRNATLACFQDGEKIPYKGEIISHHHKIKGVFWTRFNTPVYCCAHEVNETVAQNTCVDFIWPPPPSTTPPKTTPLNDISADDQPESTPEDPRVRSTYTSGHVSQSSWKGSFAKFTFFSLIKLVPLILCHL